MEHKEHVYRGLGLSDLLTAVFVTLKLCGVIDWSWWWVLSPIWISVALIIVGALILCVLDGHIIDETEDKQ